MFSGQTSVYDKYRKPLEDALRNGIASNPNYSAMQVLAQQLAKDGSMTKAYANRVASCVAIDVTEMSGDVVGLIHLFAQVLLEMHKTMVVDFGAESADEMMLNMASRTMKFQV